MIIELELINFMSHKHTKISFHRGINIFYGRKGSGKTAIFEAIRLLFGGLGKERVTSIADFVRYGESKAIIRAKVRNEIILNGKKVRLLDQYPLDELIIERQIFADGKSIFKLNNKTVTKKEIVKLLSKVNISPRNTLFFLPQERVNEWIHMKENERIELFLSAIGLSEFKSKLDAMKEEIEKKQKERKKYLKILFELEERLENKRKNVLITKETVGFFDRYFTFKLAYLFNKKSEIESEIEQLNEHKKELESKYKEILSIVENREKALREIEEAISDLEKEFYNIQSKEVELGAKKERLEEKINRLMERLRSLDSKSERYVEKLKELQKEFGTHDINALLDLKKKYLERVEEIEKEMQQNKILREIRRLENLKQDLEKKKNILKNELQSVRKKFNEIIMNLDRAGDLKKIMDSIRRIRYGGDLYGPLALEISFTISEREFEDIAPLVEALLGITVLRSFITISDFAYKSIIKALQRARHSYKFEVIKLEYTNNEILEIIRKYNEKRKKLKKIAEDKLASTLIPSLNPGIIVGWICDMIDAPPAVKAVLESKFWNVPVLVDVYSGYEFLKNLKVDVNRIVTLDGYILERNRSDIMRYIVTKLVPERILESSIFMSLGIGGGRKIEEIIEAYENEIGLVDSKIDEVVDKIKKLEESLPEEYKELYMEKNRLLDMVSTIENTIDELEKLRRLIEEDAESRKTKIHRLIERFQAEFDRTCDELERIKARKEEVQKELGELRAKREELISGKYKGVSDIDKIKSELEELPAKIKGKKRILENIERDIENLKREMKALYDLLKRFNVIGYEDVREYIRSKIIREAKKIIENMESSELERSLEILERDIDRMKEEVFKRETKLEEIQEMIESIKEAKDKLNKIESEIEQIRRIYEEELKDMTKTLMDITKRVDKAYQRILAFLGAEGSVSIEGKTLDKLKLKITASIHRERPFELDKGNFSSGEKTTIIISLILAILSVSLPPIFMFDEFDVYLDDVSLREVLFIIKNALEGIQGLITTTHREEIIEFGDRVFYVEFDEKTRSSRVLQINLVS